MPKHKEWITYGKWKNKYGDIVGVRVFGKSIVILNTSELAQELLNSRSVLYSDRPAFPMLEMMGFNSWNMGIMPLGQEHGLLRRLFSWLLSPKEVARYNDIRNREIQRLLQSLLASPSEFRTHIRRMNAGIIGQMFYGMDIEDDTSNLIELNEEIIMKTSRAGSPAAYIVNTFPIFKHWPKFLPGSGFRREVQQGQELVSKLVKISFDLYSPQQSLPNIPSLLTSQSDEKMSPEEFQWAIRAMASTSYSAGVETSTSLLLSFVLAMLHYPKVQATAQRQLDEKLLLKAHRHAVA
ncbi:cytochrome P450 [Crucibulum laeve]|uniref:Cytochrome P450 n=1 Tax=Crucibulum laeve TaxID=68775 RepID=A0A5C3LGR1_9AGAR|nr:cytochrome P450 [Crucibulum laeve]